MSDPHGGARARFVLEGVLSPQSRCFLKQRSVHTKTPAGTRFFFGMLGLFGALGARNCLGVVGKEVVF